MAHLSKIFPNTYRDSVALMQISSKLNELTGIIQASLIMATATNLELLREAGLKVPKSFIQLKQNIVDSTVIQK